MPRGDKSSYTDKQKRQAEHIEDGYESRGVDPKEAERRAWATVNKETHGGKQAVPVAGPTKITPLRGKAEGWAGRRRRTARLARDRSLRRKRPGRGNDARPESSQNRQ
jgi:hypothetical protein